MEKFTKVDMYDEVIKALGENEELVKFIQAEKERHINRLQKSKERAAKKVKTDELLAFVRDVFEESGGDALTRETVTELVADMYDGDIEITPAKVGARITKLVKEGYLTKSLVTKGKSKKTYYAVVTDAE